MSVPWSFRELADIVSKQEFLENLKEKLQVILDDINQVTKRCTSWIERTEPITYLELKQYLTDKTSNYIQKCATLACPGLTKEGIKEVSDKQSNLSTDSSGYKDEKSYKILEEEIRSMQKIVKSLDKKYRKLSNESEETSTQITKELHLASEFMSILETKIELLTQETHKSIQSQDRKIEEFSGDVEKRIEQIHLLVKQPDNDTLNIEQQNLKTELEQCQECIESLKAKEKSLTEELENSKQLIENGKIEIARLNVVQEQCQEYIAIMKSKEKGLTEELENSKRLIENGNIEINRLQAVEEKSKTMLGEYIQKVQSIFKIMRPAENTWHRCLMCKGKTYGFWYIPRLQEICRECSNKEFIIFDVTTK